MFNFDKQDVQRIAVSSVGAIALSAACIFGVAGPARAAAPVPVSVDAWKGAVERQIDTQMDRYALRIGKPAEAELALRFTADGDYAGAALARSSGDSGLDAHALQVARTVSYPALPESVRGRLQTVAMRLTFGVAADSIEAERLMKHKAPVVRYAGVQGGAGNRIAVK